MMLDQQFLLPLLFATGIVAGTIDAMVGGGGLICLPALLISGIPPHVALGTNKLQTSFGTFMATLSFYKQGLISLKIIYKGLIFGLLGAVSGALTSQILSNAILSEIIPILLLIILIYTILSPTFGLKDGKSKMNEFLFYIIFGFSLGFYDGFLGPAIGSLWIFSLVLILGYSFVKASAYAKVFNLKSNIVATICFALCSNIDYKVGIVMAAGQIIGGKIGAYLAIKNGAKLMRPVFITVVCATIGTFFYTKYIT